MRETLLSIYNNFTDKNRLSKMNISTFQIRTSRNTQAITDSALLSKHIVKDLCICLAARLHVSADATGKGHSGYRFLLCLRFKSSPEKSLTITDIIV